VIGVATLISMLFLWTKQAYLDPIRKREEDIIKKVKKDLNDKLMDYKKLIEEIGEEKFADAIYDIIVFRKFLRELKETFGRRMIPMGLSICALAVTLVSVWDLNIEFLNNLIFVVAIVLSLVLISDFSRMRELENLLSKYLEGEDPAIILSEETK